MKRKLLSIFCLLGVTELTQAGYVAGTGWVTVSKVTAADVQRFEVQGGTLCSTNVFTIDAREVGGKEQYSAVLTAATAGKKIFIETWVGCPSSDPAQNWGMKVGAITIQY